MILWMLAYVSSVGAKRFEQDPCVPFNPRITISEQKYNTLYVGFNLNVHAVCRNLEKHRVQNNTVKCKQIGSLNCRKGRCQRWNVKH